ncbi:Alpha/Beta hydrolase protein [Panaeolus papilionaceus]|nr:Alpha/Beta hydrolase protein [Panaeolus papilionaceus]
MSVAVNQDKFFQLPDNSTIVYQDIGDATSSTIVLFFHGAFGVGHAPVLHGILQEKGIHYIAPTLPGWGQSTPRDSKLPYNVCIANMTTALIQHLHPNDSNLKIYIGGGSFGTVPAQVLYGAPFDIFPYGRQIAGCFILAPFSPYKHHPNQSKFMTFQNWISVGPPSQIVPFRLVPRAIFSIMRGKLQTEEKAEVFLRELLFDTMKEEEKAAYAQWRERNGSKEGDLEKSMARNMVKSIAHSSEGCLEMADAIHSDWGFDPSTLDEEHNKRPILIVTSAGDTMAPDGMAIWLKDHYKNSYLEKVEGGHIAALFHMEELWKKLFELTQ